MVISDTHLGVTRQTGTTLDSQRYLAIIMIIKFYSLLEAASQKQCDLLINGDLFDGFEVSKNIEFVAFSSLHRWCLKNPELQLIVSAGNHDLSRDSSKKSSFENLCEYLKEVSPQVFVVLGDQKSFYDGKVIVIPHVANQEMFDRQLAEALGDSKVKTVFVHANYDNFFARESDHSLNVSAEVARKFDEQGIKLIFGHEHKKRQIGNVHIVGNQIISSIADCLGDDSKQYIVLDGDGEIEYHQFETVADRYEEVDWRSESLPNKDFIRISGTAEYSEAADVIAKISQWRKTSEALVITNAVKVGQMEVGVSSEDIKHESFDIKALVLSQLPDDLKEKFEELVNAK